ncbi:MAG: permease [Anaerolineae bacterium]
MFDQIVTIVQMIADSFLHIWPYLLLTIPLAVAVQMTGAARYINRAFQARPIVAILLATVVGAFSPFCSCGVVPVVAALLIGGVPLAPVMSFWIASPSMDPEAFFLSVATLGWELAVWRLAATLALSLGAGLLTHFVVQQGWLGRQILRTRQPASGRPAWERLHRDWRRFRLAASGAFGQAASQLVRSTTGSARLSPEVTCCDTVGTGSQGAGQLAAGAAALLAPSCKLDAGLGGCNTEAGSEPQRCGSGGAPSRGSCGPERGSTWRRLFWETASATWMVVKFMALAFFLSALIKMYVPEEWIAGLLGSQNPWAIPTAALLGVPAYASNLTALPMMSGLLAQGMAPAAALAFLIAGPTTTLPAMAAVWGLASRRVFALYVSFSLVGAVVLGYLYHLVAGLF